MKKITILAAVLAALLASSALAVQWDVVTPQSSAAWTSATALDTRIVIPIVGYSTVSVTLSATSTMTAGTLNFEASNDNGATYKFKVACTRTDKAASESTFPLAVVNQAWQCPGSAFTHFSARLNPAITGSGTASMTLAATAAPMQNTAAPDVLNGGPASTGQGLPDANTQRVFVGQKVTYSAATTAKTATAAGTGPFFAICGSSTKTVRVQQMVIGGTVATAAVYGDVILRRTSTSTSAGTATALTAASHDPNDGAATVSLVNFYTALATAGTSAGAIASQGTVFPITGTVAVQQAYVMFDYSNRQEAEALVLRGTAQCLEASFGTTTTNAPTLQVQLFWTEE
jgi:hypothetical protein